MIDENIRAQPTAREVRRTMTLNLSDAEMTALEELITKKDLDGPKIFRDSFKLYQAVEHGAASVTWTESGPLGLPATCPPPAREDAQPVWVYGVPTKHHAKEWFIAETTFGDRVVLTALPEEYNYDFRTADETYIKADCIKRWMPFPDSQYLFPHPAPDALRVAVEALEALAGEEGDCGEKVYVPCTWKPFREVASQALATIAALQAEQKGGA